LVKKLKNLKLGLKMFNNLVLKEFIKKFIVEKPIFCYKTLDIQM